MRKCALPVCLFPQNRYFEPLFTNCKRSIPAGSGRTAEEAIKQLNADYQIYKAVEQQLLHKKTRLMSKVPDLNRALDMVNLLLQKAGDEVMASSML